MQLPLMSYQEYQSLNNPDSALFSFISLMLYQSISVLHTKLGIFVLSTLLVITDVSMASHLFVCFSEVCLFICNFPEPLMIPFFCFSGHRIVCRHHLPQTIFPCVGWSLGLNSAADGIFIHSSMFVFLQCCVLMMEFQKIRF